MRSIPGTGVRPTRAVLSDLEVRVPDLGTALDDVDHELVTRAQQLPERVSAGGAERVVSIDDRVWFKIKTEAWRGAGTSYHVRDDAGANAGVIGSWWIGAVGHRRADSPKEDFYDRLERECVARRKSANASGAVVKTNVLSDHLLPGDWDVDRLRAELATHARRRLQQVVRDMAAKSLRTGHVVGFDFEGCQIRLLIRAPHSLAYVAIGATGITDPVTFALLMTSIPGVPKDDWMPEPGGAAGLEPADGEILWSAVLPAESQAALLGDPD